MCAKHKRTEYLFSLGRSVINLLYVKLVKKKDITLAGVGEIAVF